MNRFNKTSGGIYTPVIKNIYLFIDDGGSDEVGLPSYTILGLDEYSSTPLQQKIVNLIEKENIEDLHARHLRIKGKQELDMDLDYRRIYEGIFELVTTEICRSNYGFLINLLVAKKQLELAYSQFESEMSIALDILSNPSFGKVGKEFYSHIAFPVYHTFRHLPKCDGSVKFRLLIDRMDPFNQIQNKITYLAGSKGALFMPVREAILRFYNTYLEKVLGTNCEITDLQFVSRYDQPVIGIVDGISNFAFNLYKAILRVSTKSGDTELLKYKSFKKYFIDSESISGPKLNKIRQSITNSFTLTGNTIYPNTDKSMHVLFMSNWS